VPPCSVFPATGTVLHPWPPLCHRRRSTSYWIDFHASPLPYPGCVPLLAALLRACHDIPSHLPAATSSPPCSVLTPTSSPLLFCPTEPGDRSDTVCTSFHLAVHTPGSNRLRRLLLLSGEPRVAVDSHHRAPIALTDPLASFPNLCHAPQPPAALQFRPEHPCRRSPSAAASCSPRADRLSHPRTTATPQIDSS
jgi:hypothetical protein